MTSYSNDCHFARSRSKRGENWNVWMRPFKVQWIEKAMSHVLLDAYKAGILKWEKPQRGFSWINQMSNFSSPVMGQCDVYSLPVDMRMQHFLYRTLWRGNHALYPVRAITQINPIWGTFCQINFWSALLIFLFRHYVAWAGFDPLASVYWVLGENVSTFQKSY